LFKWIFEKHTGYPFSFIYLDSILIVILLRNETEKPENVSIMQYMVKSECLHNNICSKSKPCQEKKIKLTLKNLCNDNTLSDS